MDIAWGRRVRRVGARGQRSALWALVFGELIGVGFLLSPATKALGVGFMGVEMPSMPVTVALAHLAYGLILGILCRRWVRDKGWLLATTPRAELDRVTIDTSIGHAE